MASTEGRAAGGASKGLDPFGTAMLAIPDERMHVRISVAEVRALRVGAGVSFGGDASSELPAGF